MVTLSLPLAIRVAKKIGVVVVSVALACGMRVLLNDVLDERVPYVLFLAAVAISTRWAGLVSGLAATLLGLLAGTYFFVSPRYALHLADAGHLVSMLVFVVASLVVALSLHAEATSRRLAAERGARLLEEQNERFRLEQELEDARRLDAIGKLAGGVAHDFNNLLTVVLGSATLLKESMPEQPLLHDIELAAQRGTALTRQLLGFARRQVLTMSPLSVSELVKEEVGLLRRLVPEDVHVVTDVESTPWLVDGDRSQVQQVLLNLVTNARDALPQGGTIWIRAGAVTLDERFTARYPEVSPGEYVQLTVADDGVGISDEVRRRIFEPFFTTKDAGQGTGLGMAVTYGMVKQMNGYISVNTRTGGGTRFDVYWPRSAAQQSQPMDVAQVVARGPAPLRVLLVDDEELVRRVTERMLVSLGHEVLAAENGADALRVAGANPGTIDVLVTDVIMPWMNGRDLADHLRKQYPNLAVLFVSGYSDNVVLSRGVVKPGVHLLVKPFSANELAAALADVTKATLAAG